MTKNKMSGRPIQVGDRVEVTLGSQKSLFVIYEISSGEISIHPVDQPHIKNALVLTSNGWRVKGAEQINYELSFFPGKTTTPVRSSRSPVSPVRSPRSPVSPVRSPRSPVSPVRSPVSPVRSPKRNVSRSTSPVRSPKRNVRSPIKHWGPTPGTLVRSPVKTPEQPVGRTLRSPSETLRSPSETLKMDTVSAELKYIADTCSKIIKRQPVGDNEREALNRYADQNNLPNPNNVRNTRIVCDQVLSTVIRTVDPSINVDRLNTQNLVRRYDQIVSESERAKAELRRVEEEERRRLEEQLARQEEIELRVKEQFDQARKIQDAKTQVYMDEDKIIKAQVEDRCVGPSKLPETPFKFSPDSSLQGRRVEIPSFYWQILFTGQSEETQLINQPEVVNMLLDIFGEIPQGLSNEQIRELLGLPEEPVQSQIYLRIDGLRHPVYVLISGFHDGSRDLFKVSEQVYHELGGKSVYLDTQDCGLNKVALIDLKLLRDPNRPEIDEDLVKSRLVEEIANLGVLIIGDILPVQVEDGSLYYRIQGLTSEDGIPSYAVAIPEVSQEVNLSIDFESQDELADKLEPLIPNLDRSLV